MIVSNFFSPIIFNLLFSQLGTALATHFEGLGKIRKRKSKTEYEDNSLAHDFQLVFCRTGTIKFSGCLVLLEIQGV